MTVYQLWGISDPTSKGITGFVLNKSSSLKGNFVNKERFLDIVDEDGKNRNQGAQHRGK